MWFRLPEYNYWEIFICEKNHPVRETEKPRFEEIRLHSCFYSRVYFS